MKIAFIGTGVMGKPMALHLSDAGHEVSVYNRTYEKAKALEPKVKTFKSIRECIKDADVIMTIVGYPTDVIEVYDTVIEYAKRGTILVDMTTSSPTLFPEPEVASTMILDLISRNVERRTLSFARIAALMDWLI